MSKQLGLSSTGILCLKGITWILDRTTRTSVLERRYYISHGQHCSHPGHDSKRLLINLRDIRAESES